MRTDRLEQVKLVLPSFSSSGKCCKPEPDAGLIDEQYTRTPFYGSRKITAWLNAQGYPVNRKRIQRLYEADGHTGCRSKAWHQPEEQGAQGLSVFVERC